MAQHDQEPNIHHGGQESSRAIRHNKMTTPHPKEKKTFLDYPYDVRILMYNAFFASEFCGLSLQLIVADPTSYKSDIFWDATRGVGNPMTRMTAHQKVSLLLTSKAVCQEARPFFYRAHTFHMKLLDRRASRLGPYSQLSSPIQQGLRAITKIYLTDQPTKRTLAANSNVATYITFVTLACVSLKSLVIDAAIYYERPGKDYSDTAFALSELWPRLDYLCLRVPNSKRKGWEAYRDFIAPGVRWHCEGDFEWAGFSYGRQGPETQRSVFILDRACLEKDDTGRALLNQKTSDDMSDDDATSSSDDDTSDSDDDESRDSSDLSVSEDDESKDSSDLSVSDDTVSTVSV